MEWTALRVIAERVISGRKQYLIKWDKYDHTYDTWEAAESIVDKKIVATFDASVSGIRHELWSLREETAKAMLKMKEEKGDFEVKIPDISGARAHALLRYVASPPSRDGKAPLPIESRTIGKVKRSFVAFNALEDIAWVLLLHVVRPEKFYGALLHTKGRAHDDDMLFYGPELTVEYTEPRPRPDGLFVPGPRFVTVSGNVWRIIGNTGEVRGEAGMPNAKFKKPVGEHVKNLLRGRAAWGLKHALTATWAELPAGQMELSGAAVHPRASKKRRRAAPEGGPVSMPEHA